MDASVGGDCVQEADVVVGILRACRTIELMAIGSHHDVGGPTLNVEFFSQVT
jgi:hypothetical protein